MANTITKYQVQYLKDRLEDIKREKIKNFREKNGTEKLAKSLAIYDAIKEGKVKLKARKDVSEHSAYSVSVSELFDLNVFDKAYAKDYEEREKKEQAYRNKLDEAITNILDSVVLRGLDVKAAIAEFEKM